MWDKQELIGYESIPRAFLSTNHFSKLFINAEDKYNDEYLKGRSWINIKIKLISMLEKMHAVILKHNT